MGTTVTETRRQVPVNPQTGERYWYEMIFGGGEVAYGDTLVELCEVLVGYDLEHVREEVVAGDQPRGGFDLSVPGELDSAVEVEIVTRRILYAVRKAVWLQALINTEHRDDIAAMDEGSRRVINGNRYQQPTIGEWSHNVPLVLSQHEYAPYGNKPMPRGENIWWINPYTPHTLITSLHRIGDIQVFYRTDTGTVDPVRLRPVTTPPQAGPLLLALSPDANQTVGSMLADGASIDTIMTALDVAGLPAVLLNADSMSRDQTRQLIRWVQAADISSEQFVAALANAGIEATTTGSLLHPVTPLKETGNDQTRPRR